MSGQADLKPNGRSKSIHTREKFSSAIGLTLCDTTTLKPSTRVALERLTLSAAATLAKKIPLPTAQDRQDIRRSVISSSALLKDVAHLVKMKEEKIAIETQKKEIDLIKAFQEKEMKLQTEYFDKVMETVKEGHAKMEHIYGEILQRLPNVNMKIREERKGA